MENSPSGTTGTTGGYTGSSDAGTPLKEQVKQKAQEGVQQVQQQAGQVVEQARTQITTGLSGQKDQAAETLGAVADALRMTGRTLQDQNKGAVGQYAESGAALVEGVSDYLLQKDIDELVREVENFARRQPALFLGTAFALGLVAARFLKSSTPRYVPEDTGYSGGSYSGGSTYGSTYGGSTGYLPAPSPSATLAPVDTGASVVSSTAFDTTPSTGLGASGLGTTDTGTTGVGTTGLGATGAGTGSFGTAGSTGTDDTGLGTASLVTDLDDTVGAGPGLGSTAGSSTTLDDDADPGASNQSTRRR